MNRKICIGKLKKKVLIIQQPAGGGSYVALYEMVRNLITGAFTFEIIFYHKNKWSEKFKELPGCRLHYPFEKAALRKAFQRRSSSVKLINWMLLEYYILKQYFGNSKFERNILLKAMAEIDPDIVHHNNGIMENLCAIRAAGILKLPQVLHNKNIASKRKSIIGFLINFYLLRSIDFRIYYSQEAKVQAEKKYFLPSMEGTVLYDFISPKFLNGKKENNQPISAQKKNFIISSVGRITSWKGQHVLIEAINLIKSDIPDAKVFIIGSCAPGIGCHNYFNRLQQMVRDYELQNTILFTGESNDIKNLMLNSDLIVHTSIKPEPQGLVILEALHCERPVIATDAGGASEIMKKYGGIPVKPGDAKKLSTLILEQYYLRNKMNHHNQMSVRLKEDFNPAYQRDTMFRIYNNILN